MTTTSDLIELTRAELLGSQQEQLNKLTADITATDDAIPLGYDTQLNRGQYISVGIEDMYVWDYAPSSRTATVRRAMRGTVAATHTEDELVYIQPRFSNGLILKELNADIRSLSSPSNGLFRVKSLELTSQVVQTTYDLEGVGDLLDPLQVLIDVPGSDNSWPYVRRWELRRNQDQENFSSGVALRLNEPVPNGRPLRFIYKAPFTELTTLTQDVTNQSGLPLTAHDIPPLGAAARLIGTAEARRSSLDAQGDTRRAQEVPIGAAARGASVLMQLRSRRIAEERSRLQEKYPVRKWV